MQWTLIFIFYGIVDLGTRQLKFSLYFLKAKVLVDVLEMISLIHMMYVFVQRKLETSLMLVIAKLMIYLRLYIVTYEVLIKFSRCVVHITS